MSVRSIVTSSPTLTRFLMKHTPPGAFAKRGPAFARRVMHDALTRTSAYPDFLAEHGLDPAEAAREPFCELPPTSKHDYLDAYPLRECCLDGNLHLGYVVERSSGLGGGCYYWPRTREQDEEAAAEIDMGMRMYYHVDRVPTLIVSTLALGTWVAGVKLVSTLRDVAFRHHYPLTVTSPGTNLDEVLQIVRDLSPEYGQTLIFGYPPFLKTLVEEGADRGIDWASRHVSLGMGGEGFPEEWREQLIEELGIEASRDLTGIISGYGAADLGSDVGNENAYTVLVRRLCLHDTSLCRDIFGSDAPPDLFQYDPGSAFAEAVDGELLFTVSSAVPLVRYAIRDLGGTIPFETVAEAVRGHGYDAGALMLEHGCTADDIWPMPFLYVLGRADGTVTVGGANVYPENVTAALAEAGDTWILGHKLAIRDGRFVVLLEHRDPSLKKTDYRDLAKRYHPLVVEGLLRANSEYRDQYAANRRVADPLIEVFAAGTGPFRDDVGRLKRRYTVEGHPAAA